MIDILIKYILIELITYSLWNFLRWIWYVSSDKKWFEQWWHAILNPFHDLLYVRIIMSGWPFIQPFFHELIHFWDVSWFSPRPATIIASVKIFVVIFSFKHVIIKLWNSLYCPYFLIDGRTLDKTQSRIFLLLVILKQIQEHKNLIHWYKSLVYLHSRGFPGKIWESYFCIHRQHSFI